MSHVPASVYVLFAVLLWIGLTRCFPRTIRIERLIVMPAVMTILGVRSFVGMFPILRVEDFAAGSVGLAIGLTLGMWHVRHWIIEVDRQTRTIILPGDTAMLGIIMASFVLEFTLHFSVASGAAWTSTGTAAAAAAILWGLFIGMSLGRNLDLARRYFDTRSTASAL